MKKIPTVFRRNPEDMKHVLPEVTPGCEWVFNGEGMATRKYDGTCVMYDGTNWWARREVKSGKTPPPGFVLLETDENTGKSVGWVGYTSGPFAKVHNEVIFEAAAEGATWQPGTYELIGPKINGNPEGLPFHSLVLHDDAQWIRPFSMTYEGLRDTCLMVLKSEGIEGIVWHHPDGRMAKLKVRDFPTPTPGHLAGTNRTEETDRG